LNFLSSVFSKFEHCHFFIATHAPQIISGTKYLHTYLHDLEKNETQNISQFKNRSSDFQLTEVFNFPGNNNEFLIRKLVVIINKLNSDVNISIDNDTQEILNNIKMLIQHEKIDKEDKVSILFNLIESYRD
jgi:hypothetical protein